MYSTNIQISIHTSIQAPQNLCVCTYMHICMCFIHIRIYFINAYILGFYCKKVSIVYRAIETRERKEQEKQLLWVQERMTGCRFQRSTSSQTAGTACVSALELQRTAQVKTVQSFAESLGRDNSKFSVPRGPQTPCHWRSLTV